MADGKDFDSEFEVIRVRNTGSKNITDAVASKADGKIEIEKHVPKRAPLELIKRLFLSCGKIIEWRFNHRTNETDKECNKKWIVRKTDRFINKL